MLSWQNIWKRRQIAADRILIGRSKVAHVFSERHWKSFFDFTKIVSNCGLKRRTVCQNVRFFCQFSMELCIQF